MDYSAGTFWTIEEGQDDNYSEDDDVDTGFITNLNIEFEDDSFSDGENNDDHRLGSLSYMMEYFDIIRCEYRNLSTQIERSLQKILEQRERAILSVLQHRESSFVPPKILIKKIESTSNCLLELTETLNNIRKRHEEKINDDTKLFYPEKFELFFENSYKKIISNKILINGKAPNCSICGTEAKCSVVLQRKCLSCEGEECKCKDMNMCERCSAEWYWNKTNKFYKSYSSCPTCRAQYCLDDIITIDFVDEK